MSMLENKMGSIPIVLKGEKAMREWKDLDSSERDLLEEMIATAQTDRKVMVDVPGAVDDALRFMLRRKTKELRDDLLELRKLAISRIVGEKDLI